MIGRARQGDVVPGDENGAVTPHVHNRGGASAISPFTSWTHDFRIAQSYAISGGEGGLVLRFPTGAPPASERWSWEWSPDVYGEQEVLLRGARGGATVLMIESQGDVAVNT
jgi:hypothetical protein